MSKTNVYYSVVNELIKMGVNVNFFKISEGDIRSKYSGDGSKRVKALMRMLRESIPALLLIDECESLLQEDTTNHHSDGIKSEFLSELDIENEANNGIYIIGYFMSWLFMCYHSLFKDKKRGNSHLLLLFSI